MVEVARSGRTALRRRRGGEMSNPGRDRFAATSDVRAPQPTSVDEASRAGTYGLQAEGVGDQTTDSPAAHGCVPGCGHPRSARALLARRSGQDQRAKRVLRRSSGGKTLKQRGCTSTVRVLGTTELAGRPATADRCRRELRTRSTAGPRGQARDGDGPDAAGDPDAGQQGAIADVLSGPRAGPRPSAGRARRYALARFAGAGIGAVRFSRHSRPAIRVARRERGTLEPVRPSCSGRRGAG
jgi:hypothetical protein